MKATIFIITIILEVDTLPARVVLALADCDHEPKSILTLTGKDLEEGSVVTQRVALGAPMAEDPGDLNDARFRGGLLKGVPLEGGLMVVLVGPPIFLDVISLVIIYQVLWRDGLQV